MSREYSLQTYNTHLFGGTVPGSFGEYYADEQRRDRIIALMKQLPSDFVCLCEVWSDKWKKTIHDGVKDRYPFCELHETSWTEMGPGLCVFSQHKIIDTCFLEYKDKADWDAEAQKGALGLLFEVPDGPAIRLFFTHAQSGEKYALIRNKQFNQIIDLVSHFHPSAPAIIAGDLNVIFNSPELASMINQFGHFLDVGPFASPTDPAYTSDYEHNCLTKIFGSPPSSKIDYILLDDRLRWHIHDVRILTDWTWAGSKQYPCQQCSDHYPIRLTFSLW